MENKIQFGIDKCYYAIKNVAADGAVTYSTPVRLPGLTELTLETAGETTAFYADNMLYYSATNNNGYTGTLTLANFTEKFRTDVLGEVLDPTSKVLFEKANSKPKEIALMFEFDGDQKATRHAYYNLTVSRPGVTASTKGESAEPGTQQLSFVAAPIEFGNDKFVKVSTTTETPEATYNGWYGNVFVPTVPAV